MADLIIIRIYPNQPTDGVSFSNDLAGLSITANDLSWQDSRTGELLGTAANPWTPPSDPSDPNLHKIDITVNQILQHYTIYTDILSNQYVEFEAVATAVIVVPAHTEYQFSDVRLTITRNGMKISDQDLDYNVETILGVGSLPTDPTFYFDQKAGIYQGIPNSGVGVDPTLANIDLSIDGTPPKYADLKQAIQLVLNGDPDAANHDLTALSPISAARAKHIAYEIIWNRTANPPPDLPRPMEQMYTRPPTPTWNMSSDDIKQADQDRAKFEGEEKSYHATLNANAERLTGYVYALSAALYESGLTAHPDHAGLTFPVLTGGAAATTTSRTATVILEPNGGLKLDLTVPPEYFYAMGTILSPLIDADQRYKMAVISKEDQIAAQIQKAIDAGYIDAQPETPQNAAQRLNALGAPVTAGPACPLTTEIAPLLTDWLNFGGADINAFWTPEPAAQPAAYLDIVLCAVTQNFAPLTAAIKAIPITTVDQLKALTVADWNHFFGLDTNTPNIALLPPFTGSATPADRVKAFIQYLNKFFQVSLGAGASVVGSADGPPLLPQSDFDPISAFAAAYQTHAGAPFAFGGVWDNAAYQAALVDVFGTDQAAIDWLDQLLKTVDGLFRLTQIGQPDLQFSLIEALYARGFTSLNIGALSMSDFEQALIGTVAYPFADQIYANATATTAAKTSPGSFEPVNPDGTLVNCIPPPYLSPFSPVGYLHDLLHLSGDSTCDSLQSEDLQHTLEMIIANRRGPLGDLHATAANLETPIPLIDIVNENLEALAAELPATAGVVYDTAGDALAGHPLRQYECGDDYDLAVEKPCDHDEHTPSGVFLHEPAALFEAIPQYSSPATPVAKPGAYELLRADFSSPALPYSQPLDITRSYLERLDRSRYSAMRAFRKQITEYVLNPAGEPADFLAHEYRYPVRIEVACEYLGINPEEYAQLYTAEISVTGGGGGLLLWNLYGFPDQTKNGQPWTDLVIDVAEFIERTGLTYCEFIDLWRAEYVTFVRAGADPNFPDCRPCCPDNLKIQFVTPSDPLQALKCLAVFIRLWRTLRHRRGAGYTFAQLRDICNVLGLFDKTWTINPDFIRQLAALQMLRDDLRLPLSDGKSHTGLTDADRSPLLALWAAPPSSKKSWAVNLLLEHIEDAAERLQKGRKHEAELTKLILNNLDPLSQLAGFDPSTPDNTWSAEPTHTLRFAEILTKIYASDFTAGEILFLFTVQDHLDGDDPLPLGDPNEALDDPLDLPDDGEWSLWSLRRKLLAVHLSDEEAEEWSWPRIVASLRDDFGYVPPAGPTDPLDSLGAHFFPHELHRSGATLDPKNRQYRVGLAATDALMWNTPPGGPFRYDTVTSELWTELPLRDDEINEKLAHIRPLALDEMNAVQSLYFAPRIDLTPFLSIFGNARLAEEYLVQEKSEEERWRWFRREFVRFRRRCGVIAEHLAGHVSHSSDCEAEEGEKIAWRLLRSLWADENRNRSVTPWEVDTGEPPQVVWTPLPSGGAFAALLGLTGTGLLGEFTQASGKPPFWREVRGPMSAFGHERNEWNSPAPTVIPSLNLTLSSAQQRYLVARNGFALRDEDGESLGGAENFQVAWSGVLLVEESGSYEFRAGAPTPQEEAPDFEAAEPHRWRLTLMRGQRSWTLLNHRWPGEGAPGAHSAPVSLRRGAYQIKIEYAQELPQYASDGDVEKLRSGFEIKYSGPDSEGRLVPLPLDRLYLDKKDGPLNAGIDRGGAPYQFLTDRYVSTLRDIRRTYQRAFKALLFAQRFDLSARRHIGHSQSEIGFLLEHAQQFEGASYYLNSGTVTSHHAYFDFNFLPVADPYYPPSSAQDARVQPTPQRQQALFDWWERLYDYGCLRAETRPARERPVWLLFSEAAEIQPDNLAEILRHIGIDYRQAPLVLHFYQGYDVQSADLEDERWATRVWRADQWLRRLLAHFLTDTLGDARPDLWASDDPGAVESGEAQSGAQNLTAFYQNGCIENGRPRRYEDLEHVNDALRERARCALLAYLCGMDRVALPAGWSAPFATSPRDLSDLLLLDVECGLCEKASRIEEGITAVQALIQRIRLLLEPGLALSPGFTLLWDRVFGTYRLWERCRRRAAYREDWIDWEELEKARESEAFQFLESELRRNDLTIPIPGGLEYWTGGRPPEHPGLIVLQAREPSHLKQLVPPREGLGLLGAPERAARLSWLAPLTGGPQTAPAPNNPPGRNIPGRDNPAGANNPQVAGANADPAISQPSKRTRQKTAVAAQPAAAGPSGGGAGLFPDTAVIPYWIRAAIRLGARFIRVAAAGEPLACTKFKPHHDSENPCCRCCGEHHEPLIDEYYFWIVDSRWYDVVTQDADWGKLDGDPTSDWERPDKLPAMLEWQSKPMVELFWTRVHNGEFQQPRRSDEGVPVDDPTAADLLFLGRTGDSLTFQVSAASAPPPGYLDTSSPGFRYDLAIDSAIALPQVLAPPAAPVFPGGLGAYPYFAYCDPGAPLLPPSLYSPAVTVSNSLRAHCRWEAALRWLELFYNPTTSDNTWQLCPKPDIPNPTTPGVPGRGPNDPSAVAASPDNPPPAQLIASAPSDSANSDQAPVKVLTETVGSGGADTSEVPPPAVNLPGGPVDAPCCPSSPAPYDKALNRSIILMYLETLLQWTDAAMAANNPEAFALARVVADAAVRILGERPETIFASDLSLSAPMTVFSFVPSQPPLNPRLLALYDRVADRLGLIHECESAARLRNGRPNRDMRYFGDSAWRDGWKTEEDDCCDDVCCVRSPYRFTFLIGKAQELAADVRGLGAALTAAYEKGDAEYLAAMRSTQERKLLDLTLQVREYEWRAADWQLQGLQIAKQIAQTNLTYYQNLKAAGLNAGEIGYEALTGSAIASKTAGTISDAIAQVMALIPDMGVGVAGIAGTPLEINQLPIGTKLAGVLATVARIAYSVGDILNISGGLSLTEGSWDRRLQEWEHQIDIHTLEIQQIERQIHASERTRDVALRNLNMLQQQIDHAVEVQDFLRDKFTNHALYLFLQCETAALYRQMYELALCAARQAQRAFQYERGHVTRRFLPCEPWDSLHEGLLAGERLQLSLRTMEKTYLDENVREYELTKHISLRLHFPAAYLQLRTTGYCEIDIPEWMFDLDYPGQYMRRIRSVSLTVPCVVGPFTGIHCRLTLLSSTTRIDPRLGEPNGCCCSDQDRRNGYDALPGDPRIVKSYAATEAISTSSGQNDSGLFELNFRDERYLPFEFEGAVSRWRIELPPENNQFDRDSLADMIMHMNITSREAGELLRREANAAAQQHLPGDGVRFFDVRHEFSDSWQLFQRTAPGSERRRDLPIRLSRPMFPFLTGDRSVRVRRLDILFEAPGAEPSSSLPLEFFVGDHLHNAERYEGDVKVVHCVASDDWPGLYHGVLEIQTDTLRRDEPRLLGTFRLPHDVGPVTQAYLFCQYAVEENKCAQESVAQKRC